MFKGIIGAVSSFLQDPEEEQRKRQVLAERQQRYKGYVDFQVNNRCTDYLEVKGVRAYYEPNNPNETVRDIVEQVEKFTETKVELETGTVKIDEDTPLVYLLQTKEDKESVQEVFEQIEQIKQYQNQQLIVTNEPIKESPIGSKESEDRFADVEVSSVNMEKPKMEKTQALMKKVNALDKHVRRVRQKTSKPRPEQKPQYDQVEIQKFEDYTAVVQILNTPNSPIVYNMVIDDETTPKNIVDEAKHESKCSWPSWEILYAQKYLIEPKDFKKTLKDLKIRSKQFKVTMASHFYCRASTEVLLMDGRTLPIAQCQQQSEIMSYDHVKQEYTPSRVTRFNEVKIFSHLYRLTCSRNDSMAVIDCSPDTMVYAEAFERVWISVSKLKSGTQIFGKGDEGSNIMGKWKIESIENIEKHSQEQVCYSLTLDPHHNFIAGGIMIHNDIMKSIRVEYLDEDQQSQSEEIHFMITDKIKSHFPDEQCLLGSMILDTNMTFGDYRLDQFDRMFVRSKKSERKRRDFYVTEWNNPQGTFKLQDDEDAIKSKEREYKRHYLGIMKGRIVEASNLNEAKEDPEAVSMIVAHRANFQRYNYLENIKPRYRARERDYLLQNFEKIKQNKWFIKVINKMKWKKTNLKQQDYMAFFQYTSQNFFGPLNYFLRQKYKEPNSDNEHYFPEAGWLWNSLCLLPNHNHTKVVYRGIKGIDLNRALKLNEQGRKNPQFVVFTAFTSTSLNQKKAEQQFAKSKGVLLTIQTCTGKSIAEYSEFPDQDEVLILPFTAFLIQDVNADASPCQTATLIEIPMPRTCSKSIIFWVDDEPTKKQHWQLIRDHFSREEDEIEVVQVVSTQVMQAIMKHFFFTLKLMGKQVVIISDMYRVERGVHKPQAGVELFDLIYLSYGLSSKAIFYVGVGNQEVTRQKLMKSHLTQIRFEVTSSTKKLVAQVKKEFGIVE